MRTLPPDLNVPILLALDESTRLIGIPEQHVTYLFLKGCTALKSLPDILEADTLDLSGCTGLRWNEFALVDVRKLVLCDCVQLNYLPGWLTVTEEIDIANTGITELPRWLNHCRLLWRGVYIDERIAFHPESIRSKEVLRELNVERRRVMLERIGYEKFLADVRHKTLDRDTDPGGERRLLCFTFSDSEELRILSVECPSTDRRYFIRVPPWVNTCPQAAAWIAGFDSEKEYQPIVET